MVRRTYDQYCPVAEALDLVGERWTLLIVRDLLFGARRYVDLQRSLTGISPNLLSERLRELEAAGLVERQELKEPAARMVYALTREGRALAPVLSALARWGMERLAPPEPGEEIRPHTGVHGALTPWHDPAAGAGVHDHYRVHVDGTTFDLLEDDGRLRTPRPGSEPDVEVTTSADTLVRLRQRTVSVPRARRSRALVVHGDEDAFDRFLAVFSLTPDERRSS